MIRPVRHLFQSTTVAAQRWWPEASDAYQFGGARIVTVLDRARERGGKVVAWLN